MNVRNELNRICEQFGSKNAIVFKDKTVTFDELKAQSLKLANALSELGVKKGDKVAIYLPNCLEYAYSYLAIFCLGAVGVPLDFMLKDEELVTCLNHSESKVLIALPRNDISLTKIVESVPSLQELITLSDYEQGKSFYPLMAQESSPAPEVEINDQDPSLIMYTSGTTGEPKGILLNYKHLEGSPAAMEHFVDLTDQDIKLVAIPLSHIGGFIYLQNCIKFGITLILMERFNPFKFLKNVAQYKVTCFHIVPPMYNAILTLKQIDQFDLSSLLWVVVFGAPSSPEILERFHQYCPNAKLLNGWGMTETCPPNTVTPLDSDNIASVGKAAPHCEIKIVDEEGRACPAGEIGEIIISGWIVMDEYYKDPDATALMKRDGWLHTADLGRIDSEGFIYIVGRIKEVIKVGGQIVYAPEVESAIHKHEAVAEVAVIGVHDKMKGEVVKAFVVLKEEGALTAEDIRYFAREHLANFKVPQSVEILKELPKNRTGKVDKEALKKVQLVDTTH